MTKAKNLIYSIFMILLFLLTSMMFVNAKQSGTITIHVKDATPMQISLYQIAQQSKEAFLLHEEYQAYPLGDLTSSSELETLAKHYEDSIITQNISAFKQMTSQEEKVQFSDIPPGIYLVRMQPINEESKTQSTPFLIQLPQRNETGNLIYEISVYPKLVNPIPSQTISVVKLWKDNNDQYHKRPEQIEVGFYVDDVLYDRVVLTAANNWSYDWNIDENSHGYRVEELHIPTGYRSSIAQSQNQFTITNQLVIHRDDITHGFIDVVSGKPGSIHSVVTGDMTCIGSYLLLFATSALCILLYAWRMQRR